MEFALHALSPLDGRYARTTQPLSPYFSEFGLISYRVRVEVEYFIALAELPLPALAGITEGQKQALRALYTEFSEADALHIKGIEKTTNHDVKAVEYFLKEKMEALGLHQQSEFIHFGLTSQDVNNTAIPLSIKEYHEDIFRTIFLLRRQSFQHHRYRYHSIHRLLGPRTINNIIDHHRPETGWRAPSF